MTLREQVEALPFIGTILDPDDGNAIDGTISQQAVLDLIDAHRCLDPERLARWHEAMVLANCPNPDKYPEDAEKYLAALDEMLPRLPRRRPMTTTEAGRRLLGSRWLVNPYGEGHEAMTEAVVAIEAEAVNAALDKVAAEVGSFAGPDGGRLLSRAAVLAAIKAARPKP